MIKFETNQFEKYKDLASNNNLAFSEQIPKPVWQLFFANQEKRLMWEANQI